MNTITRWDPFKELNGIQNRLGTFFGRAPLDVVPENEEAMTALQWAPLVDVTEDGKEFLIKAELPEVKPEEVKITVRNGVLTLTGERKVEKQSTDKKYHRVERAYGSFLRSFTLPENVDSAKVTAEFKEGVLAIHVPKTETPKGKKIDIKVS